MKTTAQKAQDYLATARTRSEATGRSVRALALKLCHGQGEIDAVLQQHAHDSVLPDGDSYHIAIDDEHLIETTREDLTELVLSRLVSIVDVWGGRVVGEASDYNLGSVRKAVGG